MKYSIFLIFVNTVFVPLVCGFIFPSLSISRHKYVDTIREEGELLFGAKKSWKRDTEEKSEETGFAYSVEMTKFPGISWGADLSFRWIYVLGLDSSGEAANTGLVEKGDYIIGVGNDTTLGLDFDTVLKTLSRQQGAVNYTFFRGSKEQLVGGPVPEPAETTATVTVLQTGKPDITLQCPGGTNLRQLLLGNGINVYRSLTRWTNCNGKQLCGACVVEVTDGMESLDRRALNEELVLQDTLESYRLCCVTTVYGDCTVKVQGVINNVT